MTADGPPLIVLAIHTLLAETATTPEALAAAVGCTDQELAGLLSGETPLHTPDIRRIADGLGTTPAALMKRALALNPESPGAAGRPAPARDAGQPMGLTGSGDDPDPDPPRVA